MRYFTKSLWSQMNHDDIIIRTQAETAWQANCMEYQLEFEKAMKCMPVEFVEEFLSRRGMHDYFFTEIATVVSPKTAQCNLLLTDGKECVTITITGLQSSHVILDSGTVSMQRGLRWGYSEFSLTSDDVLNLCILCDDMESEFRFKFNSIAFVK